MKVITAEWLEEQEACRSQVSKFKKVFPDGARPTLKNIRLAVDNNLDVVHAATIFLSLEARRQFNQNVMEEFRKLPESWRKESNRMWYKLFREFQQYCIPFFWEAIKLDRQAK